MRTRRFSCTGIQIAGQSPIVIGNLGAIYAKAGRVGEARKILREMQELAQKTYVPPISFAGIYFGLGEVDKTFDWFEKAAEEHHGMLPHVLTSPAFDPLRSHPRYHALLRKMKP